MIKKAKKLYALIPLLLLPENLSAVDEMLHLIGPRASAIPASVLFPISCMTRVSHTHRAAREQKEIPNPYLQACLKAEGKSRQQKKVKRPQRGFLLPFC